MKKILLVLQGIMFGALATSCVDLDIAPADKFSEKVIWSSQENFDNYAKGFYAVIRDASQLKSMHFTDAYADILKSVDPMSSYNKALFSSNYFTLQGTSALDTWTGDHWTRIKRQNEFLYDATHKQTNFGKDYVERRIAEVRFLRGFSYYLLARVYGGVVLRDYVNGVDAEAQKNKPLSTEAETWDFILKDLDAAAKVLPVAWESAEDFGRATRGAAYGLMSRCALYAKKWDVAVTAANEVAKTGAGIIDSYADVFKKEGNNEVLFAVYFKSPVVHAADANLCPPGDGASALCKLVPTAEMIDSYEMKTGKPFDWSNHLPDVYQDRDPRFYASVLYNGAKWKSRTINVEQGGADAYTPYPTGSTAVRSTVTGYYLKKFLNEGITDLVTQKSTQFDVMIRYAEVLLNKAEALAQQNYDANKAEALAALNEVRTRNGNGLPARTSDEAPDLESFMALLRQERKVELAFEGFRYWDLRRWELAESTINGKQCHAHKPVFTDKMHYELYDCDGGQTRIFQKKFYKLAIPQFELSNNTAITENNPGW